jgi:wyosine [tRNA(Phe)-imidazoG37] synthetase (radical SAM superfamily)
MSQAFGPVPSRRLGRSIGVNNIKEKHCSYSCVYCQLGRAVVLESTPRTFYDPQEVIHDVNEKIQQCHSSHDPIDYLTIVPDGEPTLDVNLGIIISGLKETGIPVAVITNSSLLGIQEVRERLYGADWVSVKVDAVSHDIWRRVDRPHKSLNHEQMLEGIRAFASEFKGFLATESMLISSMNTGVDELEKMAQFIGGINPGTAYISIPTRPTAERWAHAADEHEITAAFSIFTNHIGEVQHLTGYEGNTFSSSGDARVDLLSITSVHPMREDAVSELLKRDHGDWDLVDSLIHDGKLLKTRFGDHDFFVRKFRDRQIG